MKDETYYDEDTLSKVTRALVDSGLSEQQALNAINEMLNAGILFRERYTEAMFERDLEGTG